MIKWFDTGPNPNHSKGSQAFKQAFDTGQIECLERGSNLNGAKSFQGF